MKAVVDKLKTYIDEDYARFTARLMPTVNPDTVLGIRTPILKQMATWVWKNGFADEFLCELPHNFFEENNLHAFTLDKIKDYGECLDKVNAFLPYVDNWATCDQMSPKAFKNRPELLDSVKLWIKSQHTYTVRFGICMLMRYFLEDNFKIEYLDLVAEIRSNEYYINMMIAWFFATALVKQYESALIFLQEGRLEKWTHNKAIQKAVESYRISDERKTDLKKLKIKL